jgi:cyanophycin synthetase
LAYIDTPEQMFTVKRSPVDVVLPSGTAVLKADDPLVADMTALSAGGVILFALDGEYPRMAAHRAEGKRTVFVRDGAVVLAEGLRETPLIGVTDVPLTHGGRVPFQIENVLAAAGAAWALGIDPATIRSTFEKFQPDMHDCPGRFNVLEGRGFQVVIDDSHNVSALTALIAALDRFPQERRSVVYSAGDGRRDGDIIRQGELLGAAFDRVILYDDYSASDRAAGELAGLFRQGLAGAKRAVEVLEVRDHRQAVETALSLAGPGDLVVIQPEDEDIEPTLDIVRALVLREATEESGCFQGIDSN